MSIKDSLHQEKKKNKSGWLFLAKQANTPCKSVSLAEGVLDFWSIAFPFVSFCLRRLIPWAGGRCGAVSALGTLPLPAAGSLPVSTRGPI